MSGETRSTVLGDFILKKKIGKGGMGTVYLGHQVSLDRPCAVKVLGKEFAEKPGFVDRFIREARAMAKIDHPNVVTCYAVGEDRGHNYVAMELMDGQSMQDWVEELGKLEIHDAVTTIIVCAEALHHAHELNMIHRDVKPDNILVTKKGIVKVSDLGLAKAVDDQDLGLTQSGTGLGTPHYMAPEQARNAKHVDRRVDLYALGGTLYYFLTGKTPFEGESVLELIVNKEKGQFTSARRLNPEVPERLDLIIDKLLAAKAEHRYQTCADLLKDLESLGIAGEALSFIDETIRVPTRRMGSALSMNAITVKSMPKIPASSTSQPAPRRVSPPTQIGFNETQESTPGVWVIRRISKDGSIKTGKMTTVQVITAMKTDKLNVQSQAAKSSKGPFYPLTQYSEFADEARRMATRQSAKEKDNNLAAQYEKLAKQYERRKIWQRLWNFTNNTLGFVGLLLWLACILGVLVVLYKVVPMVYEYVAGQVGLTS